jgi:hypothetical protein
MIEKLRKANEIRSKDGYGKLLSKSVRFLFREIGELYDGFVRPLLPTVGYQVRGTAMDRGTMRPIRVNKKRKLFDRHLPWQFHYYDPVKEGGLILGHSALTRRGDDVVIIGGGAGKTATVAAWRTGSDGHVIIYDARSGTESGRVGVSHIRENMAINGIEDRCEVHQAIIGDGVVGESPSPGMNTTDGPETVPPSDLPPCDVLEFDCEGAELSILRQMTIRPRILLVELEARHYKEFYDGEEHPLNVLEELEAMDYTIVNQVGHRGTTLTTEQLHELVETCYETGANHQLMNDARDSPVLFALHEKFVTDNS